MCLLELEAPGQLVRSLKRLAQLDCRAARIRKRTSAVRLTPLTPAIPLPAILTVSNLRLRCGWVGQWVGPTVFFPFALPLLAPRETTALIHASPASSLT